MTIASTQSRITYAGDGIAIAFPVPFVFFGADEIRVIERNLANGAETERLLTSDYTVSGGSGGTGTVTALAAPGTGRSWTIIRDTQPTQLVDYTPNDPFPAETHERALDRLTALVQELGHRLDRAATLGPTTPLASLALPEPQANGYIGWNDAADRLENKILAEGSVAFAGIAATRAGGAGSEAVTPRGLASLWREGDSIASASLLPAPADNARGGYHRVTGNADIAALWPGAPSGTEVEFLFEHSPGLIHDSLSLLLPGGKDVAALPGDVARFRAEGETVWRCVSAPPRWFGGAGSGLALPVIVATGSHAMLPASLGCEICFSAAGATLDLLPAADAGNGGAVVVRNAAESGDVTLSPHESELLDGFGSRLLRPGDCVALRCDGSAWRTFAGAYSYDSGELSITSGALVTLNHHLGNRPYQMQHVLRCKTAELGWSVGDEIFVAFANMGTGFNTHRAPGIRSDATTIQIRYGSGAVAFGYANGNTGAEANLANANWRLIVRARAR